MYCIGTYSVLSSIKKSLYYNVERNGFFAPLVRLYHKSYKKKLAGPPVYSTGSNEPIVTPPSSNGRTIPFKLY